jgi:septum formation topological specificity factor MinE
MFLAMKKGSAKERRDKDRLEVFAASERTRQRCNKLTEDQMRALREKALALIYGRDAKISVGGS